MSTKKSKASKTVWIEMANGCRIAIGEVAERDKLKGGPNLFERPTNVRTKVKRGKRGKL